MRTDAHHNRARIIEAFRTLALRHGRDAHMDDVAAAAGVTRVTLYRHFIDRDALRRAAQCAILDDTGRLIRAATARPQPIDRALVAVIRICLNQLRHWEAVFVGTDNVDHQLQRTWTSTIRPVVELVQASQERGELRADVPASWLVNTLIWSMQSATASVDFTTIRDPEEIVLSMFLDGARAAGP